MDKTELQSKHLAELHALAADRGVERYRMLTRDELIAALADGGGDGGRRDDRGSDSAERGREPRQRRRRERRPESSPREETAAPPRTESRADEGDQPRRRRRRRRFGRRGRKTIRLQDALLPPTRGRQAVVYAESRADCTSLLRELAAELSGGRGADPVAVLVDPSPEELADWKREAPKAEIVSAGQERHAEDALAQAARRADSGEDVVVLIDSLSRAAEEFGGAKFAKELFDAGLSGSGSGSLTVVAALERASD